MVEAHQPDCYDYCTRCGGGVAPYAANGDGAWIVGEQHDDYSLPVRDLGRTHGFATYQCPVCECRWFSLNTTDTGRVLACGHFMPEYVEYCAACGARSREHD